MISLLLQLHIGALIGLVGISGVGICSVRSVKLISVFIEDLSRLVQPTHTLSFLEEQAFVYQMKHLGHLVDARYLCP